MISCENIRKFNESPYELWNNDRKPNLNYLKCGGAWFDAKKKKIYIKVISHIAPETCINY